MLYYSKVQYIINIICHRYLTLDYDVRFFENLCALPKDSSIFIMRNVSFYSVTNWGAAMVMSVEKTADISKFSGLTRSYSELRSLNSDLK